MGATVNEGDRAPDASASPRGKRRSIRHTSGGHIAGGAAINELLRSPRRSRDIDLFHDTVEALAASWLADRETLLRSGFRLSVVRERPTFVEAEVVAILPALKAGRAVVTTDGELFRGDAASLKPALAGRRLNFHEGSIGGAFPMIAGSHEPPRSP